MDALIFIFLLTRLVGEIDEQADVQRFDRAMSRDRKPARYRVSEHYMAGSILVVFDAFAVGDRFQVFNTPVRGFRRM